MPNCKCCGKPVLVANVFHSACLEKVANRMMYKMCDEYCRYAADPTLTQDELMEQHCNNGCPLNDLEEALI